jgi:hypothetical protein
VSCEVPMVVNIKIVVFWVVMLCSLTGRYEHFGGIYSTTWYHIPEDYHLQRWSCLLRVLRLLYVNISICVVVKNMYMFFFQVVLTSACPFQLDDKTFKLLTDIFLFYDLSVYGFIQHYKVRIFELNYSQFSVIKVVNYHNNGPMKHKESSHWNTIPYCFKPVFLNLFNYTAYVNYQKCLVVQLFINLVCTSASFLYWDIIWKKIMYFTLISFLPIKHKCSFFLCAFTLYQRSCIVFILSLAFRVIVSSVNLCYLMFLSFIFLLKLAFRLHKRQEISWPVEQLASQEGLCSMELYVF